MKMYLSSKMVLSAFVSVIAMVLGSCGKTDSPEKKSETDNDQIIPSNAEPSKPLPIRDSEPSAPSAPFIMSFEFNDISNKILLPKCSQCHNESNRLGGVDLSSYESIRKSQVFPPLVIPFSPEKSSIYDLVQKGSMPKGPNKLSAEEISALRQWIANGAKRRESDPVPTPVPRPTEPPD